LQHARHRGLLCHFKHGRRLGTLSITPRRDVRAEPIPVTLFIAKIELFADKMREIVGPDRTRRPGPASPVSFTRM
jgi:hypothetical protein